jgi:hypothetical protein
VRALKSSGGNIVRKRLLVILILAAIFVLNNYVYSQDECSNCILEKGKELRELPVQRYLDTLDGQKVDLTLFDPNLLPLKFYYWENEVVYQEFAGPPPSEKPVKLKVKRYWSPACSCDCGLESSAISDSEATGGDVSELYDIDGQFMGFLIYVSNGQYITLPYEDYKPTKFSGI